MNGDRCDPSTEATAAAALRTLRVRAREVLRELVSLRRAVPHHLRESYHEAAYDIWEDYAHQALRDRLEDGGEAASPRDSAAYILRDSGLDVYTEAS